MNNHSEKKNEEIEVEPDYEVAYRKIDSFIKSKPESYFKPSRANLYRTWEDEFYGSVEDKIVDILDTYRENYATFRMDNALFIEMIKRNVECNAFTKRFIDRHPDCVIHQVNSELKIKEIDQNNNSN